jgi:hypothetical protein
MLERELYEKGDKVIQLEDEISDNKYVFENFVKYLKEERIQPSNLRNAIMVAMFPTSGPPPLQFGPLPSPEQHSHVAGGNDVVTEKSVLIGRW